MEEVDVPISWPALDPVNKSRHALRLAGILCLFLAAVLIRVGDSDAVFHMEVMSLEPAQESWLRAHAGEESAWSKPTMYGESRLRKPPMLYWVTGLAWFGLTPENSTVDDRVERARWAGILLTALGIAAVYGMGMLLGGERVAWVAALALSGMVATTKQGRMATYDAHMFAWAILASGLGLWALLGRDRRLVPGTIVAAGLCLACAVLTKGPIALLFAMTPMAVAVVCLSTDRRKDGLRVVSMFAIGGGLAWLWYWHVLQTYPEAAETLGGEYQTSQRKSKPPWYYVGLLGMVFPWTIALIGSLWMGWKKRRTEACTAFRTVLIWFLLVLVAMSMAGPKRQRYIYPLVPAAALLIGFWWDALSHLGTPRSWKRCFAQAHGILMIGTGIAFTLFLVLEPMLVRWEVVAKAELPGIPLWLAMVVGGVCVLIGIGVWRAMMREAYGWGAVMTALLVSLAMTVAYGFYVDSHHGRYPDRATAQWFGGAVDSLEIGQLVSGDIAEAPLLDEKFLLYSEHLVKRMSATELLAEETRWVVCPLGLEEETWLRQHGWQARGTFSEGGQEWRLWVRARG